MLRDTVLMPGSAALDGSIHELNGVHSSLARFAESVREASESQSDRIMDYLSSLIDNVTVSEDVRNQAVDVKDSFAMVNAIETRQHLPTIRWDHEPVP